ncbi:polysaccharide pyruvyl transferase family protein [Halomonas sp. V046]|uniref:polysaccharide pyruvyl transferase family protein n=1 Tax=Halomonas sp. V046 TaxID=3459611 RepID=UPI004044425E
MKVGLLTLTPKNNYGGILQAVALYSYLQSQGCEVVLIDKKRYVPLWKESLIQLLEFLPFQNIKNKRKESVKSKKLKPFISQHLSKRSNKVVTRKDFNSLVDKEGFEAVVVGSDQVWRYQYINDGFSSIYFLDFESELPVKRIAYAASFGKDIWEAPGEAEKISALMRKFDFISTREVSGVKVCEQSFCTPNVEVVLDPTLLVGVGFYDQFFKSFAVKNDNKNLVTYVLDKGAVIDEIIASTKSSLESVGKSFSEVHLSRKSGGGFFLVEEWLWEIKNADFVVTDSFHGMVFSVLFEKNFLVVRNGSRGASRFESFLSKLNLEERLISDGSVRSIDRYVHSRIDYTEVNVLLREWRIKSEDFLNRALFSS